MKLQQHHIEEINKSFQKMKTKNDLLTLLNYAKKLLYGDKAFPFQLRQLSYYSNPKVCKNRYEVFFVKKKSGENRIIHAPISGLKQIQRSLNLILESVFIPHPSAMGFVTNRSILDNARVHAGNYYVFNIDLKDFFFSIDQARVWKCLQNRPFNLGKVNGFSNQYEVVNIISALCCTEIEIECVDSEGSIFRKSKNVVPQGAPTSPILTNIICQRMDYILTGVAKRFGLKYTRYADDITFSSLHNVYHANGEFLKELSRVVSEQGFVMNPSKTRMQKQETRQQVTGLVVNDFANVQKRYIKTIRSWIYMWENYGFEKANMIFLKDYFMDKGHVKKGVPNMQKIIEGKLNFLKMIKGDSNSLYINLLNRFNALLNNRYNLNEFIESWETTGFRKTSLSNENFTTLSKLIFKNTIQRILTESQKLKINELIFRDIESGSFKSSEQNLDNNINNQLVDHDPLYTVEFLKQFKVGDGTGFKELVHDILLDDDTFNDIIRKVKSHPNFINHYLQLQYPDIKFLNISIVREVRKIIDAFEKKGKEFFLKTGKHPVNNEKNYTELVENFRLKYRFGNFRGTNRLRESILNICKDQNIERANVKFFPSERVFDIRATFFSWKDELDLALRFIFQGINQHSNNGTKESISEKIRNIEVFIERIELNNLFFVEVKIVDVNSISLVSSDILLSYLKGTVVYKKGLRNLCDWVVETKFEGGVSEKLNLLNVLNPDEAEIVKLEQKICGFTHILRFYDAR